MNVTQYKGMNYRAAPVDGELVAAKNISSRNFPYGDLKLSNIRKQIAKELETASAGLEQKGYQFARMSQYQDTLEKAKQYQQESEARQQWAKEHPIVSSVSSVLRSPLQGVEFLELAAENIGNDPKDLQNYVAPNVYDMVNTNAVNQVRGTVSKEIEENTDWELFGQNVASFLYQTGMSAVDSAAQVAAFGPAATVFMGGAAASSTASDIIQRGGTSNQAFWGGLAAGAAEAVFEKFSVDNLLKAKDVTSVKTLIREAVKQSGVEASEEAFTEIANIISDSIIMGENGNYAQAVAAYEAQGMSREDAQKKAVLDSIGQVLWAGAGGAISGGLTGGAYRAAGLMQYKASDYGRAEQAVNRAEQILHENGVTDTQDFYGSIGVENPMLAAATDAGKEFLQQSAREYVQGQNSQKTSDTDIEQQAELDRTESSKDEKNNTTTPKKVVADTSLFQREILNNFNQARKYLVEFAKSHFPQTVVNKETGKTIGISRTGLDKFLSGNIRFEKYASGFHIPELIENAVKVGQASNYHGEIPGIPSYEYYDSPISIDGAEYMAHIRVRNTTVGDKYYGHTVSLVDNIEIESPTRTSSANLQSVQPVNISDSISINSIPQSDTNNNSNSAQIPVRNPVQEGSNNAIPGLYWAGSQTQPGIEQTDTMGYTGTEPGTAQTVQSERMTANETRTDVSGRVAGRELSERTGEQAGIRVQSDTGRPGQTTEQSRAAAGRQALGKNLGTEKVSSKSLGLENGTDNATVQVIPESQWDEALQETARWVRDETYKDVVFVLGPMEVEKGGKVSRIRGVYLADKIIVQADHTSLTPEQIARHEEWHDITRRTPVAMRDVRQKIEDNYSVEELENIIQAYVKRMRHLLDLPENPTNEQLHEALLKAEEEVYADAYAGINAFGTNASQYQETVQEFASREKQQRQEQRQQEEQQETGPPAEPVERYSMEDEELDLDKLYEQEERARQNRIQQINKRLEKLTDWDYQDMRLRENGPEALQADEREIRKLRKELSKLEGVAEVENKKTGEKKAVPVQPILAKMEFRDNMLNLFSIPQSQRGEIGAMLDNFADKVAKYGAIEDRAARNELFNKARDLLFDRLYEEGVMQVPADEYLAMGREAVAGGRVYVPQEVKDEFGDDWADFRRRLAANHIYTVNDQTEAAGIDTWSAELAEVLPGLFESDVYDRKQALERILQVAEEGADQNLSLAEYTAQVAGETGVDVDTILMDMERQMDYQIQKFASMANLETELRARPELLRAEANERVQAIREQRDRTVQKVIDHYNDILQRRTAEMEQAVGEARATAAQRVQRAREQRDQKIAQVKEDTEQRIQRVREQRDRTVESVQAHYNEMRAKDRALIEARDAKERERRKQMAEKRKRDRELRKLQEQTLRELRWLKKNQNKAPKELKNAIDNVLGDLDLYAIGMANELNYSTKYGVTWQEIPAIYEAAKKSGNYIVSPELEKIMDRLTAPKIENLDLDQLQDLFNAARVLHHELQNRNKVLGEMKGQLFSEVNEAVVKELNEGKGYTGKAKDKFFNKEQLSPVNFLLRMAAWNPESTWAKMVNQLVKGERDVRRYKVDAMLPLQKFMQENKEWLERADGQGKNGIWYKLEVSPVTQMGSKGDPIYGDPVTVWMTPMQKIQLWLESQNDDNLRHILGGRTFVNKELYQEGNRSEAYSVNNKANTISLAPNDVRRIVSDLTEQELEFANLLRDYYNGYAKKEINRVSNILYGYDKAIGQTYAPIYTNQNYNNKEIGKSYDATAEGVGSMKARQEGAKNPSLNISAMDAFERHVESTSKFVGMAIPARNWNTMLEWTEHGEKTKATITDVWGEEAYDYIDNILTRLQNKKYDEQLSAEKWMNKLQRNAVAAIFGANINVTAKQTLGLLPAAVELKYWANPFNLGKNRYDKSIIDRYTPERAYRGMGYATLETKQLKESKNWTQRGKKRQFLLGGGSLTAMDQALTKYMWLMAENQVKHDFKDLEVGTQEQIENGDSPFYKKVAEVFEHALYNTQPMADEMHNSPFRKSQNALIKSITMFRSDAMVAYNLIRQKQGEAKYYDKTGQPAKAKAAKIATIGAVLAVILNAGLGEVFDALNSLLKNGMKYYRDDEDEITAGSIFEEAISGMISSIMGTATVGGDTLAELILTTARGKSFFGLEAPGLEQFMDVAEMGKNAFTSFVQVVKDAASMGDVEGTWMENMKTYGKRYGSELLGGALNLAGSISTTFAGVPADNVKAYVLGVLQWIAPEIKAEFTSVAATMEKNYLNDATGEVLEIKVRKLLENRLGGDQELAAAEIARLYESGVKSAKSAMFGNTPKEIKDQTLTAGQKQVYDMAYRDLVGGALDELIESDSYLEADDEQQCKMLKALYDYADDMAKDAVIPGSVELTTETGERSAFGKAAYLLESGLSLAEYIQLKSADAVDNAVKAVEAGEPVQRSLDVALMVSQAKSDLPKDATDLQKQEAVFEAVKTGPEEMTAAIMVYDQDNLPKLELAYAYGVTPGMVTDFKARFDKVYGEDMNGRKITVTQERAEDIISEMIGYSSEERAILWQMQNKSWKWQKNPYNRQIAREFVEEAGWNEEQ